MFYEGISDLTWEARRQGHCYPGHCLGCVSEQVMGKDMPAFVKSDEEKNAQNHNQKPL